MSTMMRNLTQLVVRTADLAEAEGRLLRTVVARVSAGFAVLMVATILTLGGLGLAFGALFQWLAMPLGEPGAAMLLGVVALGIAVGMSIAAARLLTR